MPKLFWKQRNEEVLHISRPTTREDSPGHQIFHLQEDPNTLPNNGNRLRRNRDTFSPNIVDKPQNTWENSQKFQCDWDDTDGLGEPLNTLRVQLDPYPGREFREPERDYPEEDFSAFQFPDDLSSRRESLVLRNGLTSTSKNVLLTGSSAAVYPNIDYGVPVSSELGLQSRHLIGFEGLLDDDITKMAAQRDQQRGSTVKFNRGMMGPILSKEEDNHRSNTSRRLYTSTRFRSESMLDLHEGNSFGSPEVGGVFGEPVSSPPDYQVRESFPFNPLGTIGEGRGPPRKRSPNRDFLNDFNSRDIMAQSIRRHTLRGSKRHPLDIRDEDPYNRIKLGIKSPSNFTVFQSETKPYQVGERETDIQTPFVTEIPSNHDDVQILNLQGFMDSSMRGQTAAPRAKSRRSNVRRVDDASPHDSRRLGRPRRKKKSKSNKDIGNGLEESDEVVLKDIDDIDEKMASLVVGPKSIFKDTSGRPITFDEAVQLRQILTGNSSMPLPKEWLEQSFIQNNNLNLSYGLIQKKGGPCGVLASVQAHLLKSLIFGSIISPDTSPASPLRPSTREWSWALSAALAEILWRISDSQKVLLTLPGALASHFDHGIGRYTPDGLTETLNIYEFTTSDSLFTAVENHLQVFTTNASSGCVLLLYSAILTRGLDNVAVDMDHGSGHLINAHGYASQEIVNLLLTGRATTNTFDGEQMFGEEPSPSPKSFSLDSVMENIELNLKNNEANGKIVLRGIRERSDIGLLSLFEHYGSCKVGTHLKSPEYPVWVICSESHYSVAFARDQQIAKDEPPQESFDIYYYDGLALQEDEIRLTIDLGKEPKVSDPVPPLELCLRTKWSNANISWNGSEPIL